MRYSEDIPHEQLSKYASDDMLIFTAFIAIFVGIALLYMGIKGRQLWMIPWSIGLIILSVVMGVTIHFEIDYLGY
jgi:hypothetical protein